MPPTLHPRVSINQLCLPGSTPADFMAAAAAIGARSVSLCSPHLLDHDGLSNANEAKAGTGLEIACISHTFAVHPNLESDTGRASNDLLALIAAAKSLGAPSIYLLTGGRGSLNWQGAASRFHQLLSPCAMEARRQGIALLVENASSLFADFHIAHSLADALLLAERCGIGLCIDLFYCWTEADLEANIGRAAAMGGLVQLGDYVLGDRSLPARAVPGDGAIPLARLVRILLDSGYTGVFDLELLGPRIDEEGPLAATTRAAHWLSRLLRDLEV